MKTDRELLELAADAIGLPPLKFIASFVGYWDSSREGKGIGCNVYWNPLADDGDALRLAVKLRLEVSYHAALQQAFAIVFTSGREFTVNVEDCGRDEAAATRRAIVLAAASLGDPQ